MSAPEEAPAEAVPEKPSDVGGAVAEDTADAGGRGGSGPKKEVSSSKAILDGKLVKGTLRPPPSRRCSAVGGAGGHLRGGHRRGDNGALRLARCSVDLHVCSYCPGSDLVTRCLLVLAVPLLGSLFTQLGGDA